MSELLFSSSDMNFDIDLVIQVYWSDQSVCLQVVWCGYTFMSQEIEIRLVDKRLYMWKICWAPEGTMCKTCPSMLVALYLKLHVTLKLGEWRFRDEFKEVSRGGERKLGLSGKKTNLGPHSASVLLILSADTFSTCLQAFF